MLSLKLPLFLGASFIANTFSSPVAMQSQLPLLGIEAGSSLWECPEFTVRCVLDGNWPSGIVGNIGPKTFCRKGIRCNQCEEVKNTLECNFVFDEECAGRCEAFGPIPF